MAGGWTEERVEELKRLRAAGKSASRIAFQLGDVSRNAVIGKIHRLGLQRGSVSATQAINGKLRGKANARRIRAAGKPFRLFDNPNSSDIVKEPVAIPPPQAGDIPRVSFADLDNIHCRWPCADPSTIEQDAPLFCGGERVPGSPYCEHHHARAYAPLQVRQRTAAPVPEKELEVA